MTSSSSPREPLVPTINFSMVCPGVYRSGYPTKKNYSFLCALRLRSILYLCPEDYAESNLKFCEENSIHVLRFPTEGNKEPFNDISEPLMHRILGAICDTRNLPLLIHCNKGKHRTGTVVACLRHLQGWSLVSIFEEYKRFASDKARVGDQQYVELYHPIVKLTPPFVAPWVTITPRVTLVTSDRELMEAETVQLGYSLLAPDAKVPNKKEKKAAAAAAAPASTGAPPNVLNAPPPPSPNIQPSPASMVPPPPAPPATVTAVNSTNNSGSAGGGTAAAAAAGAIASPQPSPATGTAAAGESGSNGAAISSAPAAATTAAAAAGSLSGSVIGRTVDVPASLHTGAAESVNNSGTSGNGGGGGSSSNANATASNVTPTAAAAMSGGGGGASGSGKSVATSWHSPLSSSSAPPPAAFTTGPPTPSTSQANVSAANLSGSSHSPLAPLDKEMQL